MVKWPICGPKLSFCCTLISVWGIIQLLFMGIFFFTESTPLLQDLELDGEKKDDDTFKTDMQNAYNQRAYNCWIAAFLYVGLLVIAGSQFLTHQKRLGGTNYTTTTTSSFAGVTTEENGFNRQYGIELNGQQNE